MFGGSGLRISSGEGESTSINRSMCVADTKRCSYEKNNRKVQQIMIFCPIKVENSETSLNIGN